MSYFKVTLLRSGIGLPARKNGVLAALGLKKRMQTVYHPVSQDIAGMIVKVKELVEVETTDVAKTKEQMREERRPPRGYFVESRGQPSL